MKRNSGSSAPRFPAARHSQENSDAQSTAKTSQPTLNRPGFSGDSSSRVLPLVYACTAAGALIHQSTDVVSRVVYTVRWGWVYELGRVATAPHLIVLVPPILVVACWRLYYPSALTTGSERLVSRVICSGVILSMVVGFATENALRVAATNWPERVRLERRLADLPAVPCAAREIGQVVLNLVLNAIYAVAGSGTVRVSTGSSGSQSWVEVADGGQGIAHEVRDRIFDPFFTTKPVGEGTGLAL